MLRYEVFLPKNDGHGVVEDPYRQTDLFAKLLSAEVAVHDTFIDHGVSQPPEVPADFLLMAIGQTPHGDEAAAYCDPVYTVDEPDEAAATPITYLLEMPKYDECR